MAFKQSPCEESSFKVSLCKSSAGVVAHLNFSIAFAARWRQELLETIFAVKVALLLDEADVDELTLAAGIHAQEVSWAPGLAQSGDKWSSRVDKVRIDE